MQNTTINILLGKIKIVAIIIIYILVLVEHLDSMKLFEGLETMENLP